MLTVHHLAKSQSERIVWMCEELEVSYRLIRYERDPITLNSPTYRALYSFGTAPVITDEGLTLGESGAIVEYLIARHGGQHLVLTAQMANFVDYVYWFHFANATLMPALTLDRITQWIGIDRDEETLAALRSAWSREPLVAFAEAEQQLETMLRALRTAWRSRPIHAYELMEKHLQSRAYFAGEAFTAADIMMVFPLTTMRVFDPRDLSSYPNILAYLQRIGSRGAYCRAMAKAEPGFKPLLE